MGVWGVAAALWIGLAAPVAGPPEYDMAWTTFARQAGWVDHEPSPVAAGERSGTAVARLVRVSPAVLRLEWHGPDGDGHGTIGPAGPTGLQFLSPLPITGPAALPHLSGGTFTFTGDADRPETFTLSYAEGFICRSTPRVCEGVAMWERRFEASGRRR
jgi:hypothetical protein